MNDRQEARANAGYAEGLGDPRPEAQGSFGGFKKLIEPVKKP
jgi:hypothetical protein